MVPISSADPTGEAGLLSAERGTLLGLARLAIAHGVDRRAHLAVNVEEYGARLTIAKGCFVTLHRREALRGCVGSLRPRGPLVAEVARTAYLAAFCDPRFSPVTSGEVPELHVHISVLGQPHRVAFTSEDDLVGQLRPHVDGVILSRGSQLGTFLPEVWEKFPEPREFLQHLKVKAGFTADYWSEDLRVERYTTEGFA